MRARAREKPMNSVPHCWWIMVDTVEAWWCELIMIPRRRMISAGKGLREKGYVLGGSQRSMGGWEWL